MKRLVYALLVGLLLLAGACGGSDAPDGSTPEAPAPATSSSDSISETDAVDAAEAAAITRGFDPTGLDVTASELFGEWQVSFEPPGGASLTGGFLVILDAATGDPIDVVPYQ